MSESIEKIKQCRKPTGEKGKEIVDYMNERHLPLIEWGLKSIDMKDNYITLDIGCGGGKTVNIIANKVDKAYGLDYSEVSVDSAKEYNEEFIEEDKVEIIQGSVETLPFEENSIDIVTAIETVYFWPDLQQNFKEVYRVLNKDGKFIVINEAYMDDKNKDKNKELENVGNMKILSPDELEALMKNAGFKKVEYNLDEDKNWVRCIGEK
ncbi:methylase involved in ubiquinone/menaquinone biosynthesis [Gottschalkia purinilytica]|uniref:Methylase involved in ubiquinone/menaquinone biosynthesis n=1 Tax=Gottschalkia purinilytica TaxID=1503 RepID=A0A0L0W9X4_GOTPU|nr:class I SAM-dependent methyltransferase [Gottschalkia purinilytica]KNF08251.1 methylase involved in ubiquinone/menaquinone biosynthesis [Gottschalkia purinilytica]